MSTGAPLFEPVGAQRLGDRVYAHLIQAIATNRLPQGAKVQEDVVAAQMGVSKTPVREALRRLQAEGFVSVDPHRTPEIRRLGVDDIEDLYRVREYLERLAVRTVAEVRPAALLGDLDGLQIASEARMAAGAAVEVGESVAYNRRFHGLLFEAAGNRCLQRLYALIDVDVRRLSYQSVRVTGRQRDAVVQHRAILEAIKAGEADQAEALMVQHVQQARRDLVAQIRRAKETEERP